MHDTDLLSGPSEPALQAPAKGMRSPYLQERLSELLERDREEMLRDHEQEELDQRLARLDATNLPSAHDTRATTRS